VSDAHAVPAAVLAAVGGAQKPGLPLTADQIIGAAMKRPTCRKPRSHPGRTPLTSRCAHSAVHDSPLLAACRPRIRARQRGIWQRPVELAAAYAGSRDCRWKTRLDGGTVRLAG
jgi:hypothetical protein